MARAASTSDVFNAIAEPRRRQIVDLLSDGDRSVGQLTEALAILQPQVSKHLRVLREVGVVTVTESGRERIYALNSVALKPVHDWVARFERIWNERLDALEEVLDDIDRQEHER